MGRVLVEAPAPEHYCSPGKERRDYEPGYVDSVTGWEYGSEHWPFGDYYMHDLQLPSGTVWVCECGEVWVAEWIPDQVSRSMVWCAHVEWRPETRRERKRRLKTNRRDAG